MGNAQREKRKRRRIVVVDDHPMVRERLAEVIQAEADLMVCGEAEDGMQALRVASETHPDLAIIDLTLKNSHGLDLIKELRASSPQLLMLVVSMHDERLHAERVLRAGARGYVMKQEATHKIIEAIRVVLAGRIYLSEAMTSQLARSLSERPRSQVGLPLERLTDRELRVFELLGQGFGTREIAEQLGLEMRTVETYRARIKEKLHLKDAHQLLQHAIRWNETGQLPPSL